MENQTGEELKTENWETENPEKEAARQGLSREAGPGCLRDGTAVNRDFFSDTPGRLLQSAGTMTQPQRELERQRLYWLCRMKTIGAVKIRKLWECFGTFEEVYNMKKQDLDRLSFLNRENRGEMQGQKKNFSQYQEEYHSLEDRGIRFITPMEDGYPGRLRQLWDMPMGLFARGGLPAEEEPSAAVVGARSCTWYGREEAKYLGKELAACGIQIISGLAYGVDAAAHRGAVEAEGAAYGVLGNGVDICYPRENFDLYRAVLEHGGLISEYGPGESPRNIHFPVRNRIISGLADAVIVVEARKRSGSLITANLALEQGKEIFALPGRVTDPLSFGCNSLIKDGAQMLLTPEDVLDFFKIMRGKTLKVEKNSGNGLAKTEKMVYSCLDSQPKHVEEIVERSGLPAGECMAVLLALELSGHVVQTGNQYYMKRMK